MKIKPYIVGSGNSAMAMKKSLAMVALLDPEIEIQPVTQLRRNDSLPNITDKSGETSLLLIANPHGLHARYILEGEKAGFRFMITEKPVAVTVDEVAALKDVQATVSVCHGYRSMWGPKSLKKSLDTGAIGNVIAIEGRYWQSSAAQRFLSASPKSNSWKNNQALNGSHDTLVDLGAHWVDLVFFLLGEKSTAGEAWLSFAGAEAPHRDTHVHLNLEFSSGSRAIASISKAFHGAGNDLEINILGDRGSLAWKFQDADRITMGKGSELTVISRTDTSLGSRQSPFHATGWLEGYTEIFAQTIRKLSNRNHDAIPTLGESLDVMTALLTVRKI